MHNLPELADSTYSGIGLKLAAKSEGGMTLALRGKLIANTVEHLSQRVLSICVREGWPAEIAMDFHLVSQLDSIGIGVICDIHSQVAEHGAALRILNASPTVLKVLRLMSVDAFIRLD